MAGCKEDSGLWSLYFLFCPLSFSQKKMTSITKRAREGVLGFDLFTSVTDDNYGWPITSFMLTTKLSQYDFGWQVEEDSQVNRATQAEQDQYEMQVRAANMVSMLLLSYTLL